MSFAALVDGFAFDEPAIWLILDSLIEGPGGSTFSFRWVRAGPARLNELGYELGKPTGNSYWGAPRRRRHSAFGVIPTLEQISDRNARAIVATVIHYCGLLFEQASELR